MLSQIKDIGQSINDSRRMFKAIQLVQKTSGGNIIVKDKQGNIAGNTQQKNQKYNGTFQWNIL